jgi:HEAT repeat protein
VPGLIEMTRSDDVELRRSAAHALGQIRGAQATEALLALLKDADATVRRTAARALGDR